MLISSLPLSLVTLSRSVVTKSVVGVFDLASNVSEGIKNTTTVFETDLDRQRLPRFISSDGILKPFDPREALGLSWLKGAENGGYFHDEYIAVSL